MKRLKNLKVYEWIFIRSGVNLILEFILLRYKTLRSPGTFSLAQPASSADNCAVIPVYKHLLTSPVIKVSFDVSALFTSIPIDTTLEVVGELLKSVTSWKKGEAENLEPEQVLECLSVCLNTSYCMFRGKYHHQRYGCAMGSSCSPLSVDSHIEYFEKQALTSAPRLPRVWYRYVEDTTLITLTLTSYSLVRGRTTANLLSLIRWCVALMMIP